MGHNTKRLRQKARKDKRCAPQRPQTRNNALKVMERVTRIELALLAWKARALPLSYTRASKRNLIMQIKADRATKINT
tara:strand:+ start:289 stop:522 length:234 start_codon:yes stop_codon:yes gene_type:complete